MGKIKKDKTSKPTSDSKTKPHSPKKKKNSDKKGSEERDRKYGMILPQSVKYMAESIGIGGLSDEVASNLSEDVSYRLRSVVQLCGKYLKHSRHKRLRCDDVNTVLAMCDVPPVFGHSSYNAPCEFTTVEDTNVRVLDDVEIDLCSYALEETVVGRKPSSLVTGQWLSAEECPKSKPEDETDGPRTGSSEGRPTAPVSESTKSSEPNVPQNLIKYFVLTCNAILGRTDLKVVNKDLKRSEKIMPIVPFLLNFISKTLAELESERVVLRLLSIVESLTSNPRIDFRPYQGVVSVSQALLKFIKSPPADNTGNYSHAVRTRAALVLARVNQLWFDNEKDLNELVKETLMLVVNVKLPARIHVAAITLLNNLPPHALRIAFWNYLHSFLKYTQTVRHDRGALHLVILEAAQRLYRNPHGSQTHDCPSAMALDKILYEFFGDSICPLRLQLLENPRFLSKYLPLVKTNLDLKLDKSKGTWRLPKCIDSMYNPGAKRLTIDSAFTLPILRKKRNPRILFKFAGSNPVPEMSLKRRRLDSRYSQFIAGKVSEGHVVLVGKFWRRSNLQATDAHVKSASIFSVL